MASKVVGAKRNKRRGRVQRATSNIFAMFDQAQIQEFKEAFNMIDQNHDGFIDKEDLDAMLNSLGKLTDDKMLENMLSQAPGPLNFTMFLTMFGEKMTGTDPEDVIINAFAAFDEENRGSLDEDNFREILTTMGDRMTDEQVDAILHEFPVCEGGNRLNYREFCRVLKHGKKEIDSGPELTAL